MRRHTRRIVRIAALLAAAAALGAGCTTTPPAGASPLHSPAAGDELAAAVRARLAEDDVVGNLPIGVTVREGVVILRGLIPDEATRARVLGIALSTPGVVQVEDRLSVW